MKDVLARHDKKDNKASKSSLSVAAALATILLMSVVAVLGPIANQPAWAGTFPGVNGKIAFASDRDGNNEIYTMNADGSEQTRLTNARYNVSPEWSPDGRKIVFISVIPSTFEGRPIGLFEIFVMNADGSEQTRLTNNSASDTSTAWGPATMTPEPSPEQFTLTINSVDLSGNAISGAWTVIRNATNGMVIDTGFTPLTFTGDSGSEYKV